MSCPKLHRCVKLCIEQRQLRQSFKQTGSPSPFLLSSCELFQEPAACQVHGQVLTKHECVSRWLQCMYWEGRESVCEEGEGGFLGVGGEGGAFT